MSSVREDKAKAKAAKLSYQFQLAWIENAMPKLALEQVIKIWQSMDEDEKEALASFLMPEIARFKAGIFDQTFTLSEISFLIQERSDIIIKAIAPFIKAVADHPNEVTSSCVTDEMRENLGVLDVHAQELSQFVRKFGALAVH